MENNQSIVYSHEVIEFVTVAAEYCAYLEQSQNRTQEEFTGTLVKILPLLYLKTTLLPPLESDELLFLEQQVQEEDYELIRSMVLYIMGGSDDYLDVFVEDMKYSETPVKKSISEDLADIYQDVRNFVGLYQQGMEETMLGALAAVRESFELYWGQTLVNTLRALHEVHYSQVKDDAY